MPAEKVLVIGGAGYIGSVLCPALLNAGYAVRSLDNFIYGSSESLSNVWEHPDFEFNSGDIRDETSLNKALEGIDHIVLLAALVGDPICKKYPEQAIQINREAPKRLFHLAEATGVKRFIFTSTCSNYGLRNNDAPADENSVLNPVSLYAETKVAVEKFLLSQNSPAVEPVILRLATAFGISPRMRFDLTVSEFTRELALGNELLVYDEDTWRPYCHIRDIAQAIILALNAPSEKVKSQVFNVGSDANNFTKKQIVEVLQKHLPNAKVAYKSGGHDPRNYRVSFEKIERALGFNATINVEGNIVRLLEAIKSGVYSSVPEYGNFGLKS